MTAALLYGSFPHHLDHLAPLASLLNIPLILDDEKVYLLAKKFYPSLEVHLCDRKEIYFFVVKNFTKIFTCIPKPLFEIDFFLPLKLLQKHIQTIWCPHGNSDKGRSSFFMEGLQKETHILIYGKRMLEFLREKKISTQPLVIGNYRYRYFLKHERFYASLLKSELLLEKDPKKKTILYAPTWKDAEGSSSFEKIIFPLVASLESHWTILFKPHPNLYHHFPSQIEALSTLAEKQNNFVILRDFPCIYPLLDHVDIYLGDMSSIGYDFLTFQKPMFFFLPQAHQGDQSSYFLHQCGHNLSNVPPSLLLKKIGAYLKQDRNQFFEMRKKIYRETFSKKNQLKEIKKIVV